MGFNEIEGDGEGGYSLFEDGDNAIAKLSRVECDVSTYQGEFQGYELELRFDAVEEVQEEDEGVLPLWPNSKITVADSEQLTSNLAQVLKKAGVTRDVLQELGADEGTVDAVLRGDINYEAESTDENEELAKAVMKHLGGVVLRVSTKQRTDADGEPSYSQVDRVLGLREDADDRFEDFEVEFDFTHPDHDGSADEVEEVGEDSQDSDGDDTSGEEGSEKDDDTLFKE